MKPCQYVYLATQMTKGMVKMTNILLQCACMLAPSGYNIHFIMCHWLGKILIFIYLSYSIMYHLVGGYSCALWGKDIHTCVIELTKELSYNKRREVDQGQGMRLNFN